VFVFLFWGKASSGSFAEALAASEEI